MHHTIRRWSPRHSYVLLAFILIIIVLVLAGCGSFNRVQEEKGTLTAETVSDVPGAVVDADSGSTTRRAIIGAGAGGVAASIIGRQMDFRHLPIWSAMPFSMDRQARPFISPLAETRIR